MFLDTPPQNSTVSSGISVPVEPNLKMETRSQQSPCNFKKMYFVPRNNKLKGIHNIPSSVEVYFPANSEHPAFRGHDKL